MYRFVATLIVIMLLNTQKVFANSNYSGLNKTFKKIENLYSRKKYENVLNEIRLLENQRFGKNGKLKFSLKDDVRYYHLKLSSRVQLKRYGSLKETVALYERLLALDSTKYYSAMDHYDTFNDYLKQASENLFKKNQIAFTRRLVNILASQGDTTWVYKKAYPDRQSLQFLDKEKLHKFLKNYDYTKIDSIALATTKQTSIENQAWALTKDFTYDFQKVRAIYIWIVNNIDYDHTYRIYDEERTFKSNTGVCSGFSYLFKEMCNKVGLKAKSIIGVADNGVEIGGHAWNSVEIEGYPFLIESTWASCVKYKTEYYYLIREKDLAKTHKADPLKNNLLEY
ncbi:transglutaminase domain-containing protein [uncultured Pontibacter sp.]|uniref:transglutaminase domain-containing protein n=1 Tax=uncultured Pontibacter sp. TaxID=453356 RepID=UPI0026092F8C|nr:transglutaminase domain-containing protein [uncultured Pontibacter sp.]